MKSILTIIDHDDGNVNRIDAAIKLASTFDAHISGLHIFPLLDPVVHSSATTQFAIGSGPVYPPEFFETREKEMKERGRELFKNFTSLMTRASLQFKDHMVKGDKLRTMNAFSRVADLTIISQGRDSIGDIMTTDTAFMLESGLPILAVPETSSHSKIGETILIAWNGSAQSARVVQLALPLLKQAEKVILLSVGDKKGKIIGLEDLECHLSRHGVTVHLEHIAEFQTVEESIMEAANINNADLIVAGAWGHSRITELIMGGTTRSLFVNQKYPVFFAH